MKKEILSLFVVLAILVPNSLFSFSIESKIQSLESLYEEAAQLKEEGFYDDSIELSREIKDLSDSYNELVQTVKRWYQLERRLKVAKQINADKNAPEEYAKAVNHYKIAETNIFDEDYPTANFNIDEGMKFAGLAIEKSRVKYVETKNDNNDLKVSEKPEIEVTQISGYYVVRLIPSKRDCLWRIAEYADIYNDPWKWKLIYQANRNLIKDPDLIYPGQKLVIPPEDVDFDEE